jgi:hypothetical protein
MPRKNPPAGSAASNATQQQSTPAESSDSRTLVISGVPADAYKALMVRTFRDAMEHGDRISVSGTVRDIILEWHRREGAALLNTR